jgi:hypothetical protein
VNSAERVIAKFGNQSALARLVGKRQSTVQHWAKAGQIPAKWQPELLRLAGENSIDLTPSDFQQASGYKVIPMARGASAIPKAKWLGVLPIGEVEIPVYVLDNGMRVISRTGATVVLSGVKGAGNLDNYIGIEGLKKYLPLDFSGQLVEFELENVVNKNVYGLTAEMFLDICKAYVSALAAEDLATKRQRQIAAHASMFLAAVAKVGLIALIDEATGYQYDRAADALKVKLRAYLAEEMRDWEKTFPDDLWQEFGRLTNWKGSVTQRPKYWGHLVTELVYTYLDPDVCKWLKDNKPQPQHGTNWHQWMTEQYGLRKLIQHIYTLIGVAKTCYNMRELRDKMAEMYGKSPVQMTLYLSPPRYQ